MGLWNNGCRDLFDKKCLLVTFFISCNSPVMSWSCFVYAWAILYYLDLYNMSKKFKDTFLYSNFLYKIGQNLLDRGVPCSQYVKFKLKFLRVLVIVTRRFLDRHWYHIQYNPIYCVQKSSAPFYIGTYYIKRATTSWTYCNI